MLLGWREGGSDSKGVTVDSDGDRRGVVGGSIGGITSGVTLAGDGKMGR